MAMANAQIGVAQAAFYPTVHIGALAGLEASSLDQWLELAQPLLVCRSVDFTNGFRWRRA
jgi:outer membrane protein TolC